MAKTQIVDWRQNPEWVEAKRVQGEHETARQAKEAVVVAARAGRDQCTAPLSELEDAAPRGGARAQDVILARRRLIEAEEALVAAEQARAAHDRRWWELVAATEAAEKAAKGRVRDALRAGYREAARAAVAKLREGERTLRDLKRWRDAIQDQFAGDYGTLPDFTPHVEILAPGVAWSAEFLRTESKLDRSERDVANI